MKRIETLRDLITAVVELKQIAGGFCETFTIKKTWFLAEDYEDSFTDGDPVGSVWICSRPSAVRNIVRAGTPTAAEEEMTVSMTVIFPKTEESESEIGRHVQLVEELTDTIRCAACVNGYGFIEAKPAHDEWGTPYLFVNMERGNFFTSIEFKFSSTIH